MLGLDSSFLSTQYKPGIVPGSGDIKLKKKQNKQKERQILALDTLHGLREDANAQIHHFHNVQSIKGLQRKEQLCPRMRQC